MALLFSSLAKLFAFFSITGGTTKAKLALFLPALLKRGTPPLLKTKAPVIALQVLSTLNQTKALVLLLLFLLQRLDLNNAQEQ